MKSPKAIFFDLDETLIENVIPVQKLFVEMYFQFADQLGHDNKDRFFTELRTRAGTLWATMFDTDLAPENQFKNCFADTINAVDVVSSDEAERLAHAMLDHFHTLSVRNVRLHDGAEQTLATLRDSGFITGIITNGMEQAQLGKIHQLRLESQVDHIVVSAQARAHKPSVKVFNLALERAGVPPSEAWQIGDHACNDVAGAIRAGMGGVFFDPNGDRIETAFNELDERPNHVIQHLSEVLSLVD
jgi:HAD superfamily hydrolase (TIGR01509 family)